ncbi:ClpP/crotonase-like domain-containing protein [Blastocladiella britannica]|nr:ClpP/crotonase-like domain-containing protein [Blastocladiella britannica]
MVQLARPKQLNTMTDLFFNELGACFSALGRDTSVRCIVLSSASDKIFTAGLDLKAVEALGISDGVTGQRDIARVGLTFMDLVDRWQRAISTLEEARVPIIAAVHGPCIGGGVDLVTAADIRVCSAASYFSIKEVDLAMAADIGTLQRLPKVMGNQSLIREWAYTGRNISAQEALTAGLVSHVAADREKTLGMLLSSFIASDCRVRSSRCEILIAYALKLAADISTKSPLAITGIKAGLLYSRDHTVADGLKQIGMWNSSQLQSADVMSAAMAILSKQTPKFAKL